MTDHVYEVVTNSDLTEGKGHEVTLGFFSNPEQAVNLAKGAGVQGTDGSVYKVPVYASKHAFQEAEFEGHRRVTTRTLVYGYHNSPTAGGWRTGWADDRDLPEADPEWPEFQRLARHFGIDLRKPR